MLTLVCVCLLAAASADPIARAEIRLPDRTPPAVFVSPEEAARARARCAQPEWAALCDEILATAKVRMEHPLDIPREGGQPERLYSCPHDATELWAASPIDHRCPTCERTFTGWPYDQVYVLRRHRFWLQHLHYLGFAYLLEQDPAYAARVREVLLTYAEVYPSLRRRDRNNEQEGDAAARLSGQTLDEANILVSALIGYDAVQGDPVFSDADRARIEQRFIRPSIRLLQSVRPGLSNIWAWHNAAVGAAGAVLDDPELVAWALNGDFGLIEQLNRAPLPSGMWWEGSPDYHFYALAAVVPLLEVAEHAGVKVFDAPQTRRLFTAPLRYVLPDQTFPPLNDSQRTPLTAFARFYDYAYGRWQDEEFAAVEIAERTWWGLFWGADTIPTPRPGAIRLPSYSHPDEGTAILRNADNSLVAHLDFARRLNVHVQPARLSMTLYVDEALYLVDPGLVSYDNPLYASWYAQTIAHNTLVVDERPQRRAPGKLLAWHQTDAYALVRAQCSAAYPGVTFDRTLLLYGDTLIDVFRAVGDDAYTFDLPLHFSKALVVPSRTRPVERIGTGAGYEHLADAVQLLDRVDELYIDTAAGRRLHTAIHERSRGYYARSPGETRQRSTHTLLRRRRGNAATFVTSYHALREGVRKPAIQLVYGTAPRIEFDQGSLEVGEGTVLTWRGERIQLGPEGPL